MKKYVICELKDELTSMRSIVDDLMVFYIENCSTKCKILVVKITYNPYGDAFINE